MSSMSHTGRKSQWVIVITLAAMVVIFFAARWIVWTQKAPGSMTVLEAQGMDMTTMRPPAGVQPVSTVKAEYRALQGGSTFPASVESLSDEEIVARVPGRVTSIAYPGDKISAGQIVAKVDAREYMAQANQMYAQSQASTSLVSSAEHEVDRLRAAQSQAIADAAAVSAGVARAQADKEAAAAEVRQMNSQADARTAEIGDRAAELQYARQDLERKRKLFQVGAISKNEFQSAEQSEKSAESMLKSAKAGAAAARQAAVASSIKVSAADQAIKQAIAQRNAAESAVSVAGQSLLKAKSDVQSQRAMAASAGAQSEAANVIAGYSELRALSDAMVAERYVSPGAVVTMGQRLLLLHDASKVRVQAKLPQSMSDAVSVGGSVTVECGDEIREGKISSVFPITDPVTRTFTVEAVLDNPGHKLFPGSYATMTVHTSATSDLLAIPSRAVRTSAEGGHYVWAVSHEGKGQKSDWTCTMHPQVSETGPGECPICKMELVERTTGGSAVARRRSVEVGPTDGSFSAIKNGLKEGDEVITAGFEGLVEGTPVADSALPDKDTPMDKAPASTMPGMDMSGDSK